VFFFAPGACCLPRWVLLVIFFEVRLILERCLHLGVSPKILKAAYIWVLRIEIVAYIWGGYTLSEEAAPLGGHVVQKDLDHPEVRATPRPSPGHGREDWGRGGGGRNRHPGIPLPTKGWWPRALLGLDDWRWEMIRAGTIFSPRRQTGEEQLGFNP